MPDINATESTSPSEGGNVEVSFANTTQTNLRGFTEASAVLTSNKHTNSDTSVSNELTTTCSLENTSQQDRKRVIKDLGITSTAFIGPSCRPELSSIEQELSEFYKELQEVDHSDEVDGDGQGQNSSCKPKSHPRQKKDSSVVVTDHSRAYRPYPDPHERSGPQWQCGGPRRWSPPTPYGNEGFGERQHLDPWYPPPPWISRGPPNPPFQFLPPPPFGRPMYPPHMRPQQNFHSHDDIRNRAPWEGPWLPPNEWNDDARGSSFSDSRFPDDYETSTSNWQQNNPEQQFHHYNTLHLILLRGLPGSGKSTLARELLSGGTNGTILSTDDYFFQDNTYVFDGTLLADAHVWNQKRAEDAMSEGRSPVIIDNTNIKAWEMKPYVKMALKNGYKVDIREPETNWKYDPIELEKRNTHGVPRETIEKMLDRLEGPVDIDIVMNSAEPSHKSSAR
ncbi:NEDD4-binding protein 2-like 2 [Triplophysa tibetana]|uniref:NEDD4-binding protein 2-like 2 n=1 Tax=Triplophysa tibetana TaxID=1572043 RepID=A0A5A9MYQ0_9TELE|nr:NEDD4-binding protein 2-like 2 [Triplophysa tibetana]